MKSQKPLLYLLLLITIALVGCSSNRSAKSEPTSSSTYTISCEVFYRSSAGGALEAAPENPLSEENVQNIIEFDNMAFEAHYQVDQYEGQALYISVIDLETGDELSRQLYQFDSQDPPKNQFIGGHGFTGLNYAYHPKSPAEMQYFCRLH
jgi:hypothetical protein